MFRCRHFFVVLNILILFSAQISFGQESWWDLYDLAIKDLRAKNWSLAEERLKAAFRLQSEQGPRIRTYGARFIRYFPEYYLGVVHFHQGKYQEALEEFLRVQNKGLIKEGDEEHSELTRLKQQTFARLNAPSTPPSIPSTQEQFASLLDQAQKSFKLRDYQQARKFANQADALGMNDAKAKELLKKIELAENVDQLKAALDKNDLQLAQQISRRVEALDPQNPELDRFKQLISKNSALDENRQQFAKLLEQSERQLASGEYGNARKTVQQAQSIPGADASRIQDLVKRIDLREASNALKSATGKKGPDQADGEAFQEIMKNANRAVARKDFGEAKRLATEAANLPGKNNQNIEDLLKRIEIAESGSVLDVAVRSFYSGQYNHSANLLERAIASKNSSAKAHFYLGCSYAALAFLQHKTKTGIAGKEKLLNNAQQQFAASRKINPSLKYDQRFISPRVLQIYERVE